jgi:tripartite-type tricarboxylate transporter receptor subunit TctC
MALLFAACGFAAAQENFPSRPVRIIVMFSVGGASDIMARLTGPRLTEIWGQQVVIENRAGADGRIAMEYVAKSAPDGYTLLIIDPSYVIVPRLFARLAVDIERDFVPVVMLGKAPQVLVAHPSLPVRSVAELIALARERPGTLNFASPGTGSAGHLAGEQLRTLTRANFVHVPYKGAGPALNDLLAGQVSFAFVSVASALSNVKAGKLRALGVTSPERFVALPDTPSLDEAGVKGFDTNQWWGIVAPAGTPRAIVGKLNADFIRAVSGAEARERIATLGAEVYTTTPEATGAFLSSEVAKWGKIIRDAGTKVE